MSDENLPTQNDENTWAMAVHVASFTAFLGFPLFLILGPLVIWIWKRDTSDFINAHGIESLNFQITISLMMIPLFFLFFIPLLNVLILPLSLVIIAIDVVNVIKAAMAAKRGEKFRYPFSYKFLR